MSEWDEPPLAHARSYEARDGIRDGILRNLYLRVISIAPDNSGVKRAWLLYLLLVPVLRADWKDLRAGMEAPAVITAVGQPLMKTSGRRGLFVTWNYDLGGEVRFARGRVEAWQAPRRREPAGSSLAPGVVASTCREWLSDRLKERVTTRPS